MQAANVLCSALSSALAVALAALSPFAGLVSDLSSLTSAALQGLVLEASSPFSLFDEATALTHSPCTPLGPCGHVVRAAEATLSPCWSGSVPSASAATAPRIANRNLCMNPSCIGG